MLADWISVKDALPEPDADVLVYIRKTDKYNDCIGVSQLSADGGWLNAGYSRRCDVSHWMPLPDKPAAEPDALDAMTQHPTFSLGCSECNAKFTGFSLVNEPEIDEIGLVIEQATEQIKQSFEAHAAACRRPALALFKESD